jgi:predicted Rossmann fold nucleotide-binding protein DprA/Smf involved in DNA uptake
MKIAIVGSRTRDCKDEVFKAVAALSPTDVVVSGGARGVDSWAAEAARERGMEVIEHLPNISKGASRQEAIAELMGRNTKIAQECDEMIAFPHLEANGKGGTWDSIRKARKMGKTVDIR